MVRVAPEPATAALHLRVAREADRDRLSDWLQGYDPLPPLARRARDGALDRLLGRPELGFCLLLASAPADGPVLGCLPVHLVPRLDLGGLAVLAAEWWALAPGSQHDAMLSACRAWLADWCRAHGVRHLLLAPGLAAAAALARGTAAPSAAPDAGAPNAGAWRLLPDGLLHCDLVPTPKQLV